MKDVFLHILLGLAYAGIAYLIITNMFPIHSAFLLACLYIYLREVGQQQSKKYDNDFRYGWDIWNWPPQKKAETIIPFGTLQLIGVLAYLTFFS